MPLYTEMITRKTAITLTYLGENG